MATMYEKMMERLVDRVADQAVEIAKLKQEAENLKKEMAYHDDLRQQVRDDLDQVREERDCLVRDLRVRQVEAKQGRERLELAEQILSRLLVNVVTVGMDGTVYYYADYVDPIKDAVQEYFYPEQKEQEPARAS